MIDMADSDKQAIYDAEGVAEAERRFAELKANPDMAMTPEELRELISRRFDIGGAKID